MFGDGVIAARFDDSRRAALPVEDAYRQVRGKVDIAIADAGEQNPKNISNPIRVYRIEPWWRFAAGALTPR